MRYGLTDGRGAGRARRPGARLALVLAGAALLIAVALTGPASLSAEESGGVMETDPSVTVILNQAGDYYVMPAGAAPTTVTRLFEGVELTSLWKYTADREWVAYDPASGSNDFAIAGGDLLWIAAPRLQAISVLLTPSAAPPPRRIAIDLRAGGDFYRVPAGAPTTAARLFGDTDVAIVWQYNDGRRTWDRTYVPAQDRENFIIEAGDLLWVEAPRAQTVGG